MTKLRQAIQINNSETYTDTTAPGAVGVFEPAFPTSNVEVDLNNIRSMINEIVSSQGGNWYDALAGRDVNQLDVDLTDLEDKTVLCRVSELENVTVGGGANHAVLTAPGETPSVVAAIGAVTTLGAVCAELPGAPGTGSTVTVAGQNAIQPKNLLTIVDTATGEVPVDSSGAEIYGLLQIENGATDGAAFDNAANQAQISFVVVNAGRTGFDLTTDAAGLTIQYAYVSRTTLDLIPEECFIPYAGFVDNSASVEVTLTNAYANQGTGAAPLSTTITSQTNAVNQSWDVVNAAGANIASLGVGAADGNVLVILGDAAAAVDSITRINGTDLDINVTNAATVANGMTFEGAPSIDIGVTDGLIESSAALTLESNSAALTMQTTTGGNIVMTSAAAITGTATTSISMSTSNAADASSNTIAFTAGNSTAGAAAGAAISVNTGDGFGVGSGGNFEVNLGSGGGTGVAGFMDVTHGGTDTERVQQLSVTGTGADQIGLFVGDSSPNGRVNAGGDIGSLFVDGTAGTMYINTDGATAWTAFAVGGAESWAATLAVGNVSGGTDPVLSSGDTFRGVDGAAATGMVIRGGDATTGNGGAASFTGGAGGTGGGNTPGTATVAGGAAGAGSGSAGGNVLINGGAPDGTGAGGGITALAANAAAVGGLGGSISINAGSNAFLSNGSGGDITVGAGVAQGSTFTAGNTTVSAGAGTSGALGGTLSLFGGNSDASGETIGSAGAIIGTAGNNSGTDRAGDVSFTAGTNSSGGGEGGRVAITGGVSAGATASPTFQLIPGSSSGAAANGFVHINGSNDEDEAVFRLSTTGTNGNDASMFVGESDPSGGAGVAADVSSIFFRDSGGAGTTGEAWLKTGAADTAWEQFLTGTSGTTSLSAAITAEGAGNFQATNSTSWGNPDGQSVVFTGPGGGGDEILEINALAAGDTVIINGGLTVTGDAGAPGQTHSITGGAGAAATNAGGGVNVTGGAGNTTGVGGVVNITGGQGGATGNGSAVNITGGDGGGTSGNGGGVAIDAGSPTDGNGGGIAIAASPGVGTNRSGGSVSLDAGGSTGTAGAGAVAITAGTAAGTGAAGTVNITSGSQGGVGASGAITIATGTPTSGAGGTITLDAADAVGATLAGGDVVIDAGDSTGTEEGGLVTIRSGDSASGDAGYVNFDMPNDDDEHILQFTTGGTNGTTTQLLTGTQNPDTVVNALPGSLYLRRVVAAGGSALFVNVSSAAGEGTDWQEVFGNTSRTFVQGVPSGTILSGADISDVGGASNVTMDFGTFPTFPATQAAFNTRTKIWINGLLQRNGAGLDVIRSGTQATAFQMVSVTLITSDVIQIEQWSA